MCKTEIFADLLNMVSRVTEVSADDILSDCRMEEIVDARCILVFLLNEMGFYPGQIAILINKTPAGIRYLLLSCSSRFKGNTIIESNLKVIREQLKSNGKRYQ